MPRSRKHKLGSLDNPVRASKRARKLSPEPDPRVAIVDEDNDLEAILAQIKEQEESEKLAKRVQNEWNHSPADVVETTEDDEALARRLAKEWAGQVDADDDPIAGPSHLTDTVKGSNGFVGISTLAGSSPQQSRTFPSSLEEDTPDTKLSGFRDFFTAKKKCTNCGKLVKSPRGHVMFNDDSMPQSVTMLMHAPCSSCRTNHCRGCFTPIACRLTCKGAAKNSKCAVMNCCAEGRAIAIFETLGGFDRQYISERVTSDSRALAALAEMKSTINQSVGPGGTGYSTGYGAIGSVGASHHGSHSAATSTNQGRGRASKNNKAKTATSEQLVIRWEEIVVRVLNTLTELLPSPYAESAHAFDLLPHGSIGALLSLSKLPELLGDLLRNDSVTDWIARGKTYHAMVSLLRRMADCELTVQVLIGQRWEMAKSPGLESWMWGEENIEWVKDKDGLIERGPPLYEHFQKLTRQCEAFLSGASRIMDATDDVDEMMMQGVSLCGDIIAAKGDIERVMTILGVGSSPDPSISDVSDNNKGKGKHKDPSIELERVYSMACEELAFKHVMLGVAIGEKLDYPNYNFASSINQTQDSTRQAKDRLHLIKELAVMATSLPPGVWVRVDEIRNDAIKILIAGPEGTPYAGGLFEFDCFMPIEYPHKPPLMHLRTTGGGTVRFNPNLYNCGKVCLSLLGTWAGRPEEGWSSSRSTLLQVLVSIQSMIFIDAPYFNEPGYGQANVEAPASIEYNKNVSMNTVRWAIVDWLNDAHKTGLWGDVIVSHFGIRKETIRRKIVEWAASDPRIRSHTPNVTINRANKSPGQDNLSQLDLLKEFDLGIDRIAGWNTEGLQ